MGTDRYKGFSFDPAALAEDVELDMDRRREILHLEGIAATATHWEVLGLPWDAPVDAAKAAYLGLVKVFHPDRYAGKRLGSYRGRLERAFRRITEARDVLSDEARRAAYVKVSAPPDRFAALEARKLEDERRAEERRARLARQNPLMARAARVKELVQRGRAAFDEGRFGQAANDLQVALSMDPANREVAALVADAKRKAAALKAGEAFDKGQEAEVVGRPADALEAYRRALEVDPTHVRSGAAATRVAIQLGQVAEARRFAEATLKGGPRAALALEAMGLVLEAEGQKKEARQMLERAVEADPRLESAKERLKKLRWSFLG